MDLKGRSTNQVLWSHGSSLSEILVRHLEVLEIIGIGEGGFLGEGSTLVFNARLKPQNSENWGR